LAEFRRSKRHQRASPERLSLFRWYRRRRAAFTSGLRDAARRPRSDRGTGGRARPAPIVAIGAAAITAAAITLVSLQSRSDPATSPSSARSKPGTFLGVFVLGVPQSYARLRAFTATTQVRPNLVVYYSGWRQPFHARFAAAAARHGASPLVQIDPTGVSLAAIASGRYDAYLHSYAAAVKAFGRRVVLSFAPEMNAPWYTWGYGHTPAATYVAAWRHVVTVFRTAGARNVTWLWVVNTIQCRCHVAAPASWWPGSSYVNWVGIDGYYYQPSWKFAALFGPTIKNIRTVTLDPILISETAAPAASQPAKIADLFAGVRAYGLLGFVWFDRNKEQAWRISSPAAIAALRRGAETLKKPSS
jgi:mannan endo-1,4-beta-mannosidase